MELTWCWIVLLVTSFETCLAYPYGVKGGAGSSAGASAGAIAGAGAISSSGGPGAESGSSSYAGSISKSTASSFAAATSGSFSFSGSGAGPFSGLGPNPFNFPLNVGGCATGKCENGGGEKQFGISPNSAGSISGAGAGSFALSSAADSNNQYPCSGNCLNKEPPSCQGSKCQYPPNSKGNPEPNDIPVNIGNKQENEPTKKPCQSGNCNSYASPTSQTQTVPDIAFPCSNGNCKTGANKLPYQPSITSNYPTNPSSDDEPVYKGGFGGPSGILKPNDYAAPPSQHYMPNKPETYNSHPNLNDAKRPKEPFSDNSFPTDNPLSPHSTPQNPYFPTNSPPQNKSPSSYSTAQNPSLLPPYEKPVAPSNDVKSPKPNKNSSAYGKPTESNYDKSTPKYISPDPMEPFSLPTNNALPAPSLLLETPKESFPQTADNSDLYSPNLPSSYNVPIIPNEDSYKPEPSSNNGECNSPKCKSVSENPSTLDPALPSFPSKTPTKNSQCAYGACNRPDEKVLSTPNYPNSKTQKVPSIATSTINVQLSTNPTDFSDDSPDFDVRYTSSNCLNGNCVEKNSNDDNKPFRNQPNPKLDPNSQPPCLNGNCPVNYHNSALEPSFSHPISTSCTNVNCKGGSFPSAPSDEDHYSNSPLDNSQPILPQGCSNGKCRGNLPYSPVGKHTSNNSPSNYYPHPSEPECSNGKCGENIQDSFSEKPSPTVSPTVNSYFQPGCSIGKCAGNIQDSLSEKPSPTVSPTLNNYPKPGCSNGQCGGTFPDSPAAGNLPYTPEVPDSNSYSQPSIPVCSNGHCGGSFPNFPMGMGLPYTPVSVSAPSKPYTPNISPSNFYPQPSHPGCLNGQCDGSYQSSPAGNTFSPGAPSLNNYPQPSIPGCSNGQCSESFSNSQLGTPNSPIGINPNKFPQPAPSGCLHGKCSGDVSGFPTGKPYSPSSPNSKDYAEKSPSDCQNGKCAGNIPMHTGDNYNPGNPSSNNYSQTSPSECTNGYCSENSPVSPTKDQYNPQTLPSSSGCANGNCGPTEHCANGKCGPKIPNQPDYPVNPSTHNEPIYGGGFGGPLGILNPNDYSAPLPSNSAQAVNPVPKPSSPHYTPNKPVHHNVPLPPSSNYPNTNSHSVFDKPQPHDTPNPENNDNGPKPARPIPQYPNAHPWQPQNNANIPHSAAGSISISGVGAYTGGFGGPPGYLKPFDDNKGINRKQSEASLKAAPNSSGIFPSYGNGAFNAAGSYSGTVPKTSEPENTGNPKESACGGGCQKAGGYGASGSFGVGGSLGLAKGGFDALIGGLNGAAATAKSLAGALAGSGGSDGSHALSGSFASSSAVASSGAYKGGYGR